MKFSSLLLQHYIDIPVSVEQLSNDLTLKTCEVEEIFERKIPDLVVVGKVIDVYKHPNADTLFVTKIDCGAKGTFQICTGGENVTKNSFVPVALPGCYLPVLDLTIGERKMRGEESNGMICSKREVGFNEDEEYHWIWTLQLSKNPEDYASLPDEWKDLQGEFSILTDEHCGESLAKVFPWMEGFVLDVDNKTLTHRADLFGHFGLAKEIGAIYSIKSKIESIKNKKGDASGPQHDQGTVSSKEVSPVKTIDIQTDLCSFYGAISGSIKLVDESTAKANRFRGRVMLRDLGLQPRHDWVNFTNLFMYMTGQPIHVFDADKINGGITVRQAQNGELFLDLTGKEHVLSSDDIVIADDTSVLALAGIYGGLESGVSETTKNVLIEIAHFDPVQVRKTGMRLGIRTDAQQRYEKYLNPSWTKQLFQTMREEWKLDEVLDTIVESRKSKVECNNGDASQVQYNKDANKGDASGPQHDQGTVSTVILTKEGSLPGNISIEYNLARCSKLIYGDETSLDEQDFCKVLTDLGFVCKGNVVTVPAWRSPQDITIEQDLVEEYIRIRGYETVPTRRVTSVIESIELTPEVQKQRFLEQYLLRKHFNQVETYPWVNEEQLQTSGYSTADCHLIANPIDANLPYLRPTMFWSMLGAVAKNAQTFESMKLFDIGKIWKNGKEMTALGLVIAGSGDNWKDHPFVRLKGVVEGVMNNEKVVMKQGTNKGDASQAQHDQGSSVILTKEGSQTISLFHPLQQCSISIDGVSVGTLATVHPSILEQQGIASDRVVAYAELLISEFDFTQALVRYENNEQQLVRKEAGFLFERNASYDQLMQIARGIEGVKDAKIVDLYVGDRVASDKKAVTVSIKLDMTGQEGEYATNILWKLIEEVKGIGGELRN